MSKNFVIVQKARIRKTVIKFYEPIGLTDLIIHYNVPRTEKKVFKFVSRRERDNTVECLDALL
ncbi:MAG: hypothetical protein WCX46_04360 [Candidatus Paceibacterota bacterium]